MKKLAALWVLFAITGCSHLSGSSSQTAVYDFGMVADSESRHLNVRFAGITAVPGLTSTDIRYRLVYKDASRVYAYTESRWLASPAELLAQRLRQRVTFDDTGNASCTLRLELTAFDQVFDSPQTGHGIVHLRALLSSPDKRAPVLLQDIAVEKPMDIPNAQGGVVALTAATNEAINQLIDWSDKMDCRS